MLTWEPGSDHTGADSVPCLSLLLNKLLWPKPSGMDFTVLCNHAKSILTEMETKSTGQNYSGVSV